MNMPLPTKAKMTAFVCNGRMRPNVRKGVSRFNAGQKSWQAASNPAEVPTSAQMAVAMANARTMRLSYLNVSTVLMSVGWRDSFWKPVPPDGLPHPQ
jgi:hypothetical protein